MSLLITLFQAWNILVFAWRPRSALMQNITQQKKAITTHKCICGTEYIVFKQIWYFCALNFVSKYLGKM